MPVRDGLECREELDAAMINEPGRHVSESGMIVYEWPPQGRFKAIWERLDVAVTDEEKHIVISLLHKWQTEHSRLVAYTDDDGELVDVEYDWGTVDDWLRRGGACD